MTPRLPSSALQIQHFAKIPPNSTSFAHPVHPNMQTHLFLLVSILPTLTLSWDLSSYGLEDNYYASNLAIFHHRAFLTIPRSSCFNNISNPTLIELPPSWQNENVHVRRKKLFGTGRQKWGNCKDLQDAVSAAADSKHGKLWVLDRGNEDCSPKIVVYNLYTNQEAVTYKLKNVDRGFLKTIVVDADVNRAYLGGMPGALVVFSLSELKWWKIKLSIGAVATEQMAAEKNGAVLFLSGADTENVYALNLTAIRTLKVPKVDDDVIFVGVNITTLGQKLGPSSAMTTDYKNGLIYFLTRDYAIVRWNTREPLTAEYHDVLAQSYEHMPYVSQFVATPQNVWALVNPSNPSDCGHKNPLFKLPSRLAKVVKYTKS